MVKTFKEFIYEELHPNDQERKKRLLARHKQLVKYHLKMKKELDAMHKHLHSDKKKGIDKAAQIGLKHHSVGRP